MPQIDSHELKITAYRNRNYFSARSLGQCVLRTVGHFLRALATNSKTLRFFEPQDLQDFRFQHGCAFGTENALFCRFVAFDPKNYCKLSCVSNLHKSIERVLFAHLLTCELARKLAKEVLGVKRLILVKTDQI